MNYAARVMAASAFELFQSADLIAAAKADFQKRTRNQAYTPLLQPDQKPPLDYRKSVAPSTPTE
jgi:aminobenzoyl-glutamate utilization protein B